MLRPRAALLSLLSCTWLLLPACAGSQAGSPADAEEPAPQWAQGKAADAASLFQTDYADELSADDTSFLTAVASYYLAPGEEVAVAPIEDEWAWAPSETPVVRFALDEAGSTVVVTRGEESQEVSARTTIEDKVDIMPVSYVLSPQDTRWRVLIHEHHTEARDDFVQFEWFPVDTRFIAEGRFVPASERTPTPLQTSRGEAKTLYLAGQIEFELRGQACVLQAFAYTAEAVVEEELLVPFKDDTTGKQTYGAGRYLELRAPDLQYSDFIELDFNRATNPYCAYSEHYNCPFPPSFNTLELAVEAGVLAPSDH